MTATGALLLVGCGKMGGALLSGWLAGGIAASDVTVVEPAADSVAALGLDPTPRILASLDEIEDGYRPRCMVFAVKPQMIDDVAPGGRRFAEAGALSLSIAAGKTLASFEAALGETAAIVRSMPNTPAAIGRGITAAVANAHASADDREVASALLAAAGEVVWVEDEALMDAVTAVSGSGPAYVFHLVECLAAAGEAEGLSADTAMALARATVSGAGALLDASPDSAETLRRNVTSPGGTTAAGLEVLMAEPGLADLIRRTVAAAAARSRELGA